MSGVNSGRNVGNVISRQSEPLGSRFGDNLYIFISLYFFLNNQFISIITR